MNDTLKVSGVWVIVLLAICGVFVYHVGMVNDVIAKGDLWLDLANRCIAQGDQLVEDAVAIAVDQAVVIDDQASRLDDQASRLDDQASRLDDQASRLARLMFFLNKDVRILAGSYAEVQTIRKHCEALAVEIDGSGDDYDPKSVRPQVEMILAKVLQLEQNLFNHLRIDANNNPQHGPMETEL